MRAFTLLEIMVCLLILAVAAGAVGIRIVDALSSHRFHVSVGDFTSQVKELQLLAMTHRTDMGLQIFKDRGEWKYQTKIEPSLKLGCSTYPFPLSGTAHITLDAKPFSSLPFSIYSSGRIEPRGVLEFRDGEESIWVDLRESLHIKICNRYPPKEEYTTQIPEFPCKSPAQPSSIEEKSLQSIPAKEGI